MRLREAARRRAFETYLAAGAEGRTALWRIALAAGLLFAAHFLATTVFLLLAALGLAFATGAAFDHALGVLLSGGEAGFWETALFLSAALAGLAAMVPATALILHSVHGRRLSTLFGARRRLVGWNLATGLLATAALSAMGMALSAEMGWVEITARPMPPYWTLLAAALIPLVFLQCFAEELVFRGYFLQALGARFRSPLVWALIPSIGFGLLHYQGADAPLAVVYLALAGIFGLFAAALVWRTGGISAAVGCHTGNNLMALLVFDPPIGIDGVGMFQISAPGGDLTPLLAVDAAALCLLFGVVSAFGRVEGRVEERFTGRDSRAL